MTTTTQTQIESSAAGPLRVRGDEGEVEQHNLKDQIAADRHIESKNARAKGLGMKMSRMQPPGAV